MASPAFAPPDVRDVTLALFAGLKTDIAPSDIPEGLSPDTEDGIYLPGDWQSRPCLSRLFAPGALGAAPGATSVLYEKTYVQPNGDPLTLLLTSQGQLWVEDINNAPLAPTNIFQVSPGLYAQSVTEFGREYIAFSDLLHGQGVPLQFDGTNLDRVTQDGPGASPTVVDSFQAAPLFESTLKQAGGGAITSATQVGNIATIVTALPHGLVPGESILVLGVGVSGYNVGVVPILTVPTTTSYTYFITATGLGPSSGGATYFATLFILTNSAVSGVNVNDVAVISGAIHSPSTAFDPNNGASGNPPSWTVTKVYGAPDAGFGFDLAITGSTQIPTTGDSIVNGTINFGGQSSPGAHQVVCMFLTRQGAITRPSPPLSFVSAGNLRWTATNIPIGPSNVVARILGFTGAGGDNFFIIPASVTLPNPSNPLGTPITVQSTIVPDNVSTTFTFDVADNSLLAGVPIDQIGNDLFDQVVLGPVLGFFAFASRLSCWGDYTKIENFLNMGFCGGYLSTLVTGTVNVVGTRGQTGSGIVSWGGSGAQFNTNWQGQITIAGVVYTIVTVESATEMQVAPAAPVGIGQAYSFNQLSAPLGWTPYFALGNSGGLSTGGVLVSGGPWAAGMVWQITGDGSANRKGCLAQSAYLDAFGDPLLSPSTTYFARMWLANPGGATVGQVTINFFSPSTGYNAFLDFNIGDIPVGGGFLASPSQVTPAVIPADMLLLIYDFGAVAGTVIQHGEIAIVFEENPYRNNLSRWSYAINPEGFAQTTGNLGASDDASPIQCLALLRQSCVLGTSEGIHEFTDNDGEPDTWNVNQVTRSLGAVSLRGCDPGKFGTGDGAEDWLPIASKNGVYIYAGAEFWKISQEISRGSLPQAQDPRKTWDDINWACQQTIVAKNDPAKRRAYFAVPINGATTPNCLFVLDYREMDTATQIAAAPPLHITIQGKMKSSDLTRKWSTWNISANDLEILVRPGNQRHLFIAGNTFDNVYSLDPAKLTDDDFGAIAPYYTTYFFTDHDQEQALQLGADMKLVKRIHAYVAGVGIITITPIVNSLYNFYPQLSPRILVSDIDAGTFLKSDLEWTIAGLRGQRIAFRIAVQPLPGTTDVQIRLQKFIVGMMKDPVAQFRQSGI